MDEISNEIKQHITEAYGYDREFLEHLIDAFDIEKNGFVTIKDEDQNICAYCFIGYMNFVYYDHILTASLISCLGFSSNIGGADMIKLMNKTHLPEYNRTDISMCEVPSQKLKYIYARFCDGNFAGGTFQQLLTQEQALAYPQNNEISLRRVTANEFYPLYEQWVKRRDYQLTAIATLNNIKKLGDCIDLIVAYGKADQIQGLTVIHKNKHFFSAYLEPIIFDAINEDTHKAMIRYLAENYGRSGRDILILANSETDDSNFVTNTFISAINVLKIVEIYAQAHKEEHRVIHLYSSRNPDACGYYTIHSGVANYTKEPIEGAEELTHKELNQLLIPMANCCSYF